MNTNRNISIDEKIHNLEHNQKVIIKLLEQIKKHLWHDDEGERGFNSINDKIDYEEQQAVNYIHNVLIPDLTQKEAEKGDMVAQGAWIEWAAKPVIEYLKTQDLIYIGKALEELKNQMLPIAVDIVDWVLEQLESLLLKQYQNADDNKKKIFKNKIKEKFPNSRLLEKL